MTIARLIGAYSTGMGATVYISGNSSWFNGLDPLNRFPYGGETKSWSVLPLFDSSRPHDVEYLARLLSDSYAISRLDLWLDELNQPHTCLPSQIRVSPERNFGLTGVEASLFEAMYLADAGDRMRSALTRDLTASPSHGKYLWASIVRLMWIEQLGAFPSFPSEMYEEPTGMSPEDRLSWENVWPELNNFWWRYAFGTLLGTIDCPRPRDIVAQLDAFESSIWRPAYNSGRVLPAHPIIAFQARVAELANDQLFINFDSKKQILLEHREWAENRLRDYRSQCVACRVMDSTGLRR